MIKKVYILVFILLISFILPSQFTAAQQESANVLLTIKDVTTNLDIDKVTVHSIINEITRNQYVPKDELLKLRLDNGSYSFELIIDDLDTQGNDYYGNFEYEVKNTLIAPAYVMPIGSIRGIVKDKLDNVIPNANLKIECNNDVGIIFPKKTDSFGGFNFNAPIGQCKVYAAFAGNVQVKEVEVKKGSLSNIEINIDRKITSTIQYMYLTMFIIILFILIILYILKKRKKVIRKETKKLGNRAKQIIPTLKDRGKIVVNLIKKSGTITQAKIHHETGLAKSSLFRTIQSLENKNIITTNQIGKVKRIKLSNWFLGEEKEVPNRSASFQ